MSCKHTPRYPPSGAAPSQSAAASACTIIGRHAALEKAPRAVTVPEGNRTIIERSFWEGLGPMQRAAVISHERAHVVIGLDVPCESCADKVGGYMMREWGYSPEGIAEAYATLRVPRERNLDGSYRDAAKGALEGARRAERGMAARGLSGTTTLTTAQKLRLGLPLTTTRVLTEQPVTTATGREPLQVAVVTGEHATAVLAPTIPTPAPTGAAGEATAALSGESADAVAPDLPVTIAPASSASATNPPAAPVVATPAPKPSSLWTDEVKTQVIAGVIVAVILAVVLKGR